MRQIALGAGLALIPLAVAGATPLPPVKPDRGAAVVPGSKLPVVRPSQVDAPPSGAPITEVSPVETPAVTSPDPALSRDPPVTIVLPPAKPQTARPAPVIVPEASSSQPAAIPQPKISAAGLICQDPRLVGEPRVDFVAPRQACGVLKPVRIREIAGIELSTPATLNCPTARRVADWLTGVADPAAKAELGSGIKRVWVMASYACRTRNNRPGARISEHGKGRAIDIGGVWLKDDRQITVTRHWGGGKTGAFLKRIHDKACGLFHTVLGPNADRHHQDHFHFDTAQRGGKPYCR